ncbi:24999_t:CDS:2, partial [Dentiscutata erythropus]
MARSIFKYSENDVLSVRLSGVDKNNKGWQLKSNEIEFIINNEYRIRQPKGALTILDEQSNFIGFIRSKPEKKGKMVNEWGPK